MGTLRVIGTVTYSSSRQRDYVDVTIDDPKAYTRLFTVTVHQSLMVDTELLEFVCLENEKDQVDLVAK